MQRGPEIEPHGAEHAVAEAVNALVNRARPLVAAGGGTHPLQYPHVEMAACLQRALDDAVIATGCEAGPALADDGRIAAPRRYRLAAECVSQLMSVAQHRAVLRRGVLEHVEGGAEALPLEGSECSGHTQVRRREPGPVNPVGRCGTGRRAGEPAARERAQERPIHEEQKRNETEQQRLPAAGSTRAGAFGKGSGHVRSRYAAVLQHCGRRANTSPLRGSLVTGS